MEKVKEFIFNGKGNVTLSLSIIATIIGSTWYLATKFHDIENHMDHSTRHRWSSVHQHVYNKELEITSKHDVPDVQAVIDAVASDY